MFKTWKKYIFLFMLIAVPSTALPQSGKILGKIFQSGELRIGTSGSQPPFTMKSKEVELIGYEIELAELLADAMNLTLKFVEKPFSELLPALEEGKVDIVMSGMTITPKRNVNFTFAGPYIVSGKSILGKADRFAELDEMDEINKPEISIAALKGSTSQSFVEKNIPKVKLLLTSDYEAAVKMVMENKVDIFLADYPICVLSMLRHQDAGLMVLEIPLTIEPIGIAMRPDAFQLHNLLVNYLGALQMSGILTDLEEKWFEDASWLFRLP